MSTRRKFIVPFDLSQKSGITPNSPLTISLSLATQILAPIKKAHGNTPKKNVLALYVD
jgi:hypothetical protein